MPGYQPITAIAASLLTDEQTLLDFRRKGWIQAVERNGTVFMAAGYSAAEMDQIVRRRAASVNPEEAGD
jgi:hypothetical protein